MTLENPMTKTTAPLERVARKGPRRTRRVAIRWIKRVLLAVAAAGVVAAIVAAMLPDPVAVDVARASYGPLEVEIREDGRTRVRDRFVIAAPISGELSRVTLRAGDEVDADSIVAKIQPSSPGLLDDRMRGETTARLAAARVRERQAVTAIARARLARDAAIREANRTRTLTERGATPAAERERTDLAEQLANEDLAAAELQRAAAAAEIQALRATLDPRTGSGGEALARTLTAGRVLRVLRESAGPIAAGTPIVEIGDPRALEVVVDVLSRDAERIAPGMVAELATTAPQPLRATVVRVEPSAFTRISALGVEEQRVNVLARLDASAPWLGDGYRVDARIILWRGDRVLRVPASALFRDHGEWAIYVVIGDRAVLRHVGIGHRGRLDVEITRGLDDGAVVIVHPGDRVRDGSRIAPRH
jgi:HlyD family secretion protein